MTEFPANCGAVQLEIQRSQHADRSRVPLSPSVGQATGYEIDPALC
jgi:hypothetical protein